MNKKILFPSLFTIACAIFVLIIVYSGRFHCNYSNLGKLKFHYSDVNIDETLTKEQSKRVSDIFNGKRYIDEPSCGFSEDASISFDGEIFAIASDSCRIVKIIGKDKCIELSESEIQEIHSIFEQYGGYFPCV